MEKHNRKNFCNFLTLILTIFSFMSSTQPTSASKTSPTYTNFVKTKCNTTTYPALCIKTLYPYASHVQNNFLRLCNTALNIAIQGALNASSLVSKLASQNGLSRIEAAALKDCMYDVKDAIYELKQTLTATGHLGDADREFELANAKTWASAAISDSESCVDGVTGTRVNPVMRNKIKSCLLAEEKLISNALALINHLH